MSKEAVLSDAKKLVKEGRQDLADEATKDINVKVVARDAKALRNLDRQIGKLRAKERKIQYSKNLTRDQKEKTLLTNRKAMSKIMHDAYDQFSPGLKDMEDDIGNTGSVVEIMEVEHDQFLDTTKTARDFDKEFKRLEKLKDRSREDKVNFLKMQSHPDKKTVDKIIKIYKGNAKFNRKLKKEIKQIEATVKNPKLRAARIKNKTDQIKKRYEKEFKFTEAIKKKYNYK